jgi:hypothetical protein
MCSYFGDEDELIDTDIAPEEEAGQFAFGSNVDSSSQQFNFEEDVTMS